MSATLENESTQGHVTLDADMVTIGQASDNRIVLDDENVSTYHAELRPAKRGYTITDVSKKGGVFVNDARLEKRVPYKLSSGDSIRIGNTTYTYKPIWTLQHTNTPSVADETPALVTVKRKSIRTPRTIFAIYGGILAFAIVVCTLTTVFALRVLPDPGHTLTAYCTALQRRDYGTAYKQLDSATQKLFNVVAFTQYSEDNEGAGAVTGCDIANVSATNASASGTVRYTYANHHRLPVTYTLSYTASNWFITNASISTPKATLTTYCNALMKRDYPMAYTQVSNDVKAQESEKQFATRTDAFMKAGGGGIASCVVSNVINSGGSATGTLTFTSSSKRTAIIDFVLSLESGSWKLVSEQPRRYGAQPTAPATSGGDSDG
jgi:limonene-1,2-epoxide hydrolase